MVTEWWRKKEAEDFLSLKCQCVGSSWNQHYLEALDAWLTATDSTCFGVLAYFRKQFITFWCQWVLRSMKRNSSGKAKTILPEQMVKWQIIVSVSIGSHLLAHMPYTKHVRWQQHPFQIVILKFVSTEIQCNISDPSIYEIKNKNKK